MRLPDFVARSGLGRLAVSPLDTPLPMVPLFERMCVYSGLRVLCRNLPNEAITRDTSWEDVEFWIANSPDESDPSAITNGRPRVHLRPICLEDIPALYNASLSPSSANRWRYRGRTVSPESFAIELWSGVLCQFTVADNDTSKTLGLVVAYNADLSNGHCYFGLQRVATREVPGGMVEGCAAFVSYIFENFPFRQIYCEIPTHNQALGRSLADLKIAQEIACYPDHHFGAMGYEDLRVYLIRRQVWIEFASNILAPI